MKMTTEKVERQKQNDLLEIYFLMKDKYPNASEIYMYQFENEVFLYKPLGRKHYKMLINSEVDIFSKEDAVCKECVVYPENYDFDNCEAGLPSALAKVILENSCLTDANIRQALIDQYRSEMFDLDNQITCIINEAFPQFDIEDIENWDVEKTAKYLSRAEWKLQNFRGFQFNEEYFDYGQASSQVEQEEVQEQQVDTNEDANKPTKEKLTPEKLRQLKAQFPEIDWENDAIMRGGVDAMADSVDTMAPALRPGW